MTLNYQGFNFGEKGQETIIYLVIPKPKLNRLIHIGK